MSEFKINSIIVDIVSCNLFNASEPFIDISNSDFGLLMDEALKQAVFPLVYSYFKNSTNNYSVYFEEGLIKYSDLYYAHIGNNIRNQNEHVALNTLLSYNQIEYVVLKGKASAFYYPQPLLRQMGDVDFLIKKEDRDKVDLLLRKQGFIKQKNTDKHSFHWNYKKGPTVVELHWECPGIPEKTVT